MTGITIIVIVGAAAQWLAYRLRLPSILLLLAAGFAIGAEGARWVDPDELFGHLLFPLVSLSVAVLLFEGGLSLRLPELKEQGVIVRRLVSAGALVTWLLSALAARFLLGLDWRLSVLLGALLTVTGPTVVLPLLRQIRPSGSAGTVLKWEGILIDPIGAVLAVLVLEGILGATVMDTVVGVLQTIVVGGGIGIVLGWLTSILLERYWLPDPLHNPVALAFLFGGFTLANHVQNESGLLTATLMGVYLANQKAASVRHILEFKETIRDLLIAALFLVLTARLRFEDFAVLDGSGAIWFLVVMLLVVRPACVAVSTWRSSASRAERAFMAAMAPRGIVAASVASIFAERLAPEADALVPATFAVILATVLVYGLAAGPLARRLGLAVASPQGVLVLGAQEWARELAATLKEQGLRVLMVDTNPDNAREARMAGLEVYRGSLLSEETELHLDLAGIGRLFALTPNDEVNQLAAVHYAHLFGRGEVYQLVPKVSDVSKHLRGRFLWGEEAGYRAVASLFRRGARFKATSLTEQFDFAAWKAEHGPDALPLVTIDEDGAARVATVGIPLEPEPGHTLIGLVG